MCPGASSDPDPNGSDGIPAGIQLYSQNVSSKPELYLVTALTFSGRSRCSFGRATCVVEHGAPKCFQVR
jgi:hypothetical protein